MGGGGGGGERVGASEWGRARVRACEGACALTRVRACARERVRACMRARVRGCVCVSVSVCVCAHRARDQGLGNQSSY